MKAPSLLRTAAHFSAVALALSTFACGDGAASNASARVYTGEITGTDVRVGIIATERRARVFFCGGTLTFDTMTRWITADVDANHQLRLAADAGAAWSIQGTVTDAEVSGQVDVGVGLPRAFRATVVSERTISGLYEGTAACGRVGLIVVQATPDTAAVGQGACVGPVFEQVNPLEPIIRTADGAIRVTIGKSTSEREVRAAAPPAD